MSESKKVGSIIVIKHRSVGGGYVFGAYEPSSIMGKHSTILHVEGQCYGAVGTRRLPAEIEALPVGLKRSAACDAFRKANVEEAYVAILMAYPEASEGTRVWNGEIEVAS